MAVATLTSKGQTTIPKEVRDLLRLKPGDKLDFVIEPDGRVMVRAATIDVMDLAGMLHREGRKRVSDQQMKAGIVKGALKSMR